MTVSTEVDLYSSSIESDKSDKSDLSDLMGTLVGYTFCFRYLDQCLL